MKGMPRSFTGLSHKQIFSVVGLSFLTMFVVYRVDKLKDIATGSDGFFDFF